MVLFGMLARESIPLVKELSESWSQVIRNVALSIILLRSGLNFDITALKNKGSAILRLTFIPQIFEAIITGIMAVYLLDIPPGLAVAMGFMISAVASSIILSACRPLRNEGYGVSKGIHSMLISASSLDDVIGTTVFGLCIGVGFTSADMDYGSFISSEWWAGFIMVPFEILVGIGLGIVVGMFIGMIESFNSILRSLFCLAGSLTLVFGAEYLSKVYADLLGAGYLATIIFASFAAKKWGNVKSDEVENRVNVFWIILMPVLYGVLGSGLDFDEVNSDIMSKAFVVMITGVLIRIPLAYLSVCKADLNTREKLFISIAWIPKATIQAALGGVILGIIDRKNLDAEYYKYGQSILAITLLSILITTPLGALLIGLLGKKLLQQGNAIPVDEDFSSDNQQKYVRKAVEYLYLRNVIPNKNVKVIIVAQDENVDLNKTNSLSKDSDYPTPVISFTIF